MNNFPEAKLSTDLENSFYWAEKKKTVREINVRSQLLGGNLAKLERTQT